MKGDYELGSAKVEDLWYWMTERQRIWVKKQTEPPPWTEDPILQEWKFTNVYREQDKGTIALRDMQPHGASPEQILFNTAWYRIFNRYEHATDIGWCEDWHEFATKMRALRDKWPPPLIFTSAHMTWAPADCCKVEAYIQELYRVWEMRNFILAAMGDSLEQAFETWMFAGLKGFAGFICYEIVSDFRWNIMSHATDIHSWANIGPGCARGLERLGLPVELKSLQHLWTQCPMPVEMRDIEHSLCEFDKYMRVKTGAGTPRSRYKYGPS